MQAQERRRLKPYRIAIALILVLLVCVALAACYMLWKQFEDSNIQGANRAQSAARIVSANAGWALETSKQVLSRVDESLGADLGAGKPALPVQIASDVARLTGSPKVYFTDATGSMRLTTDPQFRPLNVEDREYFIAAKQGEPWHISSLLISRLNGEQVFTISKRIERNGQFQGVAVLSFNPELMKDMWRSLDLDTGSTVALVRDDGMLVSRFPLPDGPMDLSTTKLFTENLPNAQSGVYENISPADSVHRIVAYTRVPGTNLIAIASVSVRAAFAAFWIAFAEYLAVFIPLVIGLVMASIWTFQLLFRDAQRSEREAEFRLLAEAMPSQVWTARPDGNLDWFNSRVYQYSGEAEGALDGSAWARMVHPDDVNSVSRLWTEALASATPYEVEFRLKRYDGAYRYHISRAVPFVDDKGNMTRWIGTNTDIDDQKKVTQQLAVSETRLRLAIEAGQLAVWEIHVRDLYITPSPALNRLYGFADDATPSLEAYQSLYAPGEIERVGHVASQAVERGESEFEVEIHHVLAGGLDRWLLVRAQIQLSPEGEIDRLIGVAIDVTARKQFEQALEQSERRFRLSQRAAGLGALELDIATGIVIGSESFWSLWGLSERESAHISLLESIVLPEDKDVRSTAETRKAGTAVPNVEYRIRRPDTGQIRWLSRQIEFIHDTDGTPLKMFGIMQDITERKDVQARQAVLMYELEHRIKNILAMVMAIAKQTFKNNDIETAREEFQARLMALGNAHDILTKTRWTEASMREVLETSISPLPQAQISLEGQNIQLKPNTALSMALAVHELGTNALKYGALSVPEGRVVIYWEVTDAADGTLRTLAWHWREAGGPSVSPPTRKGFGSQLITRVLAADFGGTVDIDYAPAGIDVRLVAPVKGEDAV